MRFSFSFKLFIKYGCFFFKKMNILQKQNKNSLNLLENEAAFKLNVLNKLMGSGFHFI